MKVVAGCCILVVDRPGEDTQASQSMQAQWWAGGRLYLQIWVACTSRFGPLVPPQLGCMILYMCHRMTWALTEDDFLEKGTP